MRVVGARRLMMVLGCAGVLSALGGCPPDPVLSAILGIDSPFESQPPADVEPPAENNPPDVDAGGSLTVKPGELVVLDGSGTRDPDGDSMIFWWVQTAGSPQVELVNGFSSVARFDAPADVSAATLRFRLTAIDGKVAATRDVLVRIEP